MSRPDLETVVKRKYEDPAEVAEFAALAGQGLARFEEAMVGVFSPGDLVLDVGCGGGREAVPMARRGIRVVALDLVPAMVHAARRYAAAQGVSLLPVVASAKALPFRDGVFDGVAMLGQVIAHVPDRDGRTGVLRAIRQSLRPGGTLALTTHNRRCHVKFRLYFAWVNRWRRIMRGLGSTSELGDYDRWTARISQAGTRAPVFFHMYDREEALADLHQTGFTVLQAKSRAEFETGRDDPARRDRDYLLGFLASRAARSD